jgi:hypothetical protein
LGTKRGSNTFLLSAARKIGDAYGLGAGSTLDGGLSRAEAETEVGRIASEVLTNPVIEEFRFTVQD